MNSIISWVRCWIGFSQTNRSILALQRTIDRLQKQKNRSDKEILVREKAWDRLQIWYQEEIKRNRAALENASDVSKKLEAALEVANDSIKTFEEVTIPGLVAANNLFVQRWEAETSIYVARRVAASSVKEVE